MEFVNIVYKDMLDGDELANLLILMIQSIFSGATHHVENEINKKDAKMLNATSNLIKRGQEIGGFRSGIPYELAVFFY